MRAAVEALPQTAAAPAPLSLLLGLEVRTITDEAEGIRSFELVEPNGALLPPFEAGAHIDVHLGEGLVRQYSLCNDPRERHRYVIAVLYSPNGGGGSKLMHEQVREGGILSVSAPRNNFRLVEGGAHYMLLAGGIGITPMLSMIERLTAIGVSFTLHYCTRSAEKTAFRSRLGPLAREGRVVFHHDGGDPSKGLDVAALLREHTPGTHLYYCGPAGLMSAAKAAAAHWPAGSVHFEYFTPPAAPCEAAQQGAFHVQLAGSGAVFQVPSDKSIVEVLREGGVAVETSCEAGICGTCRTRYSAGEPQHNDLVLSESEQQEFVMICCARSNSPTLVLDI